MNNLIYKLLSTKILLMCLLSGSAASAQSGSGSTTLHNGLYIDSGTTWTDVAATIYLGPGTYTINGTWNIYGKNVWIHPLAQISGNGLLAFQNPDDNPYYPDMTGATTIDHNNGLPIAVAIAHLNPNNVILGDIADPGYGTTNPAGALAAALHFRKGFSFMIDNGDVLLNGHDFFLEGDAALLVNASVKRMVVTGNSIAGHIVVNKPDPFALDLPVGIAEGDYTPVRLYDDGGTFHVSVISYEASGAPLITAPEKGMDRIWHIYGGPVSTLLGLQHNTGLPPSGTDGTAYVDNQSFNTRYLGGGTWSANTSTLPDEYAAPGLTESSIDNPALRLGVPFSDTANAAWLTKSSNKITPLPVRLLSFDVCKNGNTAQLTWATASEQNDKGFGIEHSTDGRTWYNIGFVNSKAGNNSGLARLEYSFVHHTPANGLNLYRLAQTDYSGTITYSMTRTINFAIAASINIYPNPATDIVHIDGLDGNNDIHIYDVAGRLMIAQKSSGSFAAISLRGLADGVYQIQVLGSDGNIITRRLVKGNK